MEGVRDEVGAEEPRADRDDESIPRFFVHDVTRNPENTKDMLYRTFCVPFVRVVSW